MKNSILIFAVATTMSLAACSSSDSSKTSDAGEVAETADSSVTYNVDPAASTVQWTGSKLFDVTHVGTIQIQDGQLSTTDGSIASGNFTMDMSTLQEINNEDAESAAKLTGHLKSPDFFNVDSFPTSKFEIVEVNGNNIKGNLTIKGITKMIEFPANVEMTDNGMKATASFTINRNDWGVTWGSKAQPIAFLKDNLIKEEVKFDVTMVANKS